MPRRRSFQPTCELLDITSFRFGAIAVKNLSGTVGEVKCATCNTHYTIRMRERGKIIIPQDANGQKPRIEVCDDFKPGVIPDRSQFVIFTPELVGPPTARYVRAWASCEDLFTRVMYGGYTNPDEDLPAGAEEWLRILQFVNSLKN